MLMVLIFVISFIDGERLRRVDEGGVNIYYHKKREFHVDTFSNRLNYSG